MPDLRTPTLLVAMPQVLDPFFHKGVVLLIHHAEEGSVGLILNRPTGIPVREILEGMEIGWQGEPDVLTHFGGPVQPQIGTVLFTPGLFTPGLFTPGSAAHDDADAEAAGGEESADHDAPAGGSAPGGNGDGPASAASVNLIVPGLALTQHVGDLGRLARRPPQHFRLFLGYAGWGEGQLLDEILRNDWLTAPVDTSLVFADDPQSAWAAALRSVGVEPESLPSWSVDADGGDAN